MIQWTIGLNITEPLPFADGFYFPDPRRQLLSRADASPGPHDRSFYDDPDAPTADGTGFRDQPARRRTSRAIAGRAPFATATCSGPGPTRMSPRCSCSAWRIPTCLTTRCRTRIRTWPTTRPYPLIRISPSIGRRSMSTSLRAKKTPTGDGMASPMTQPIDPDDDPVTAPVTTGFQLPRGTAASRISANACVPDSNYWSPLADNPEHLLASATTARISVGTISPDSRSPGSPRPSRSALPNSTVGRPLRLALLGEPSVDPPPGQAVSLAHVPQSAVCQSDGIAVRCPPAPRAGFAAS